MLYVGLYPGVPGYIVDWDGGHTTTIISVPRIV